MEFALPELAAPAPQPTPQPVPAAPATPAPQPQRVESPEVQAAPAPREAAQPEPTVRRGATQRVSRSGISLNNLLGGEAKTATELVAEEAARKAEVSIDPRAEEKITLAKEKMVDDLMQHRRRFAEAFKSLKVDGHVVTLTVPSQELFTEIMRDKSEWQRFIAEHGKVQGFVELNIIVNEQIRIARPITLEDRLRHMVAKNERITEMIERLALDAE